MCQIGGLQSLGFFLDNKRIRNRIDIGSKSRDIFRKIGPIKIGEKQKDAYFQMDPL